MLLLWQPGTVFLAHVKPLTNLDTIASQIHRRSQHPLLHPQCVKSVLFKLPPDKKPVDGASCAWLAYSKQAHRADCILSAR